LPPEKRDLRFEVRNLGVSLVEKLSDLGRPDAVDVERRLQITCGKALLWGGRGGRWRVDLVSVLGGRGEGGPRFVQVDPVE